MSQSANHRRRRTSARLSDPQHHSPQSSFPSSNNHQHQHQHTSPSPDSKNGKGFWSYLNKRLGGSSSADEHSGNSHNKYKRGGDTLLPTTYKVQSPAGGRSRRKTIQKHGGNNSHNNNAQNINHHNSFVPTHHPAPKLKSSASQLCGSMNNMFLMGGVDKRRYRRKKRGLVHRVFWSSPPRRLVVSFAGLYFFVYHVLVPIASWLILGGASDLIHAVANGGGDDILKSLSHTPRWDALPSMRQERKYLAKLAKQRDEFEEHGTGSSGSSGGDQNPLPGRWKVLEQIAPEWFHRFDSDIEFIPKKKEQQQQEQHNDEHPHADSSGDENSEHETHGGQKQKQQNEKQQKDKLENPPKQVASADDKANAKAVEGDGKNAVTEKQEPDNKNNNNEEPSPSSPQNAKNSVEAKISSEKKSYHQPIGGSNRNLVVMGGIAEDAVKGETKSEKENMLLPQRNLHNMEELGAKYSSCGLQESIPGAVTLVVQTSIDRLWILGETCSRYSKDPIVVVVFVPHSSSYEEDQDKDAEDHAELLELLATTETNLLQSCPNLTLVRYEADRIESLVGRYPVNRLRNVGLDLVRTSHVLMMDVDFVPSRDLERLLPDAIAVEKGEDSHSRAIVVPAFEKKAPKSCQDAEDPSECMAKFLRDTGDFLPATFSELRECYNAKDCIVFQSKNNWDGHSTTLSDKWLQKEWYEESTTDSKQFRKIQCFHTARYEPYVVVEWCPTTTAKPQTTQPGSPVSPYYDERFYGYGKNKIELVSHLRRSNVRFEVLPEGFLVHNPHPESSAKETWLNRHEDLHKSMDVLYAKFMGELGLEYEGVHKDTTKLCERPKAH